MPEPLIVDSWEMGIGLTKGLSHLMLHNFRNYQELDLVLQGCPVVLTGPNGAGKTNILEAISFLSPGRGLRNVKLSQITNLKRINQENTRQSSWTVVATIESENGSVQLGTKLDYTASGNERRLVKIDGQIAKSQASLTDYVSVIWVTPQMNQLFLEAASLRRKFVDRLVYALDSSHATRIHRYDHHMRERSRLLKDEHYDPLWISTIERYLAEDGVAIAVARQEVIKSVQEAQRQEKTYPFPQFYAKMKGDVESWLEYLPALAVEDMYTEKLKFCRRQDADMGGASIGPHRSDFQVHHSAKQLPAELCSTGEQKILLLAVVLAFSHVQENYHICPTILLLDDVAAHLDDQHRLVLFEEICSPSSFSRDVPKGCFQAWVTGTDQSTFQGLYNRAQFLTVQNATLTSGF